MLDSAGHQAPRQVERLIPDVYTEASYAMNCIFRLAELTSPAEPNVAAFLKLEEVWSGTRGPAANAIETRAENAKVNIAACFSINNLPRTHLNPLALTISARVA